MHVVRFGVGVVAVGVECSPNDFYEFSFVTLEVMIAVQVPRKPEQESYAVDGQDMGMWYGVGKGRCTFRCAARLRCLTSAAPHQTQGLEAGSTLGGSAMFLSPNDCTTTSRLMRAPVRPSHGRVRNVCAAEPAGVA